MCVPGEQTVPAHTPYSCIPMDAGRVFQEYRSERPRIDEPKGGAETVVGADLYMDENCGNFPSATPTVAAENAAPNASPDAGKPVLSPAQQEEAKLIRRLQMMMTMTLQVIVQDGSLSVDEASQMIADSRNAALHMFPGKELAYDLIWKPRFQRAMLERFRLQ